MMDPCDSMHTFIVENAFNAFKIRCIASICKWCIFYVNAFVGCGER
jgi:hypothetical protein